MYIPIKGVFALAYDLHIFRGENWWGGTDRPITAEELLSVEGVKTAGDIAAVSPLTGFSVAVPSLDMFSFGDVLLMLKKGMVTVSVRDEAAAELLRPIADALGALIQGDEGEFY